MVTPTVLIKAEVRRIPEPVATIAEMRGDSDGFSVAGRADRVAIARVARNEEPADLISERMRLLEGIVEAETMNAFRAYSGQTLGAEFKLGLD